MKNMIVLFIIVVLADYVLASRGREITTSDCTESFREYLDQFPDSQFIYAPKNQSLYCKGAKTNRKLISSYPDGIKKVQAAFSKSGWQLNDRTKQLSRRDISVILDASSLKNLALTLSMLTKPQTFWENLAGESFYINFKDSFALKSFSYSVHQYKYIWLPLDPSIDPAQNVENISHLLIEVIALADFMEIEKKYLHFGGCHHNEKTEEFLVEDYSHLDLMDLMKSMHSDEFKGHIDDLVQNRQGLRKFIFQMSECDDLILPSHGRARIKITE